MRASDCSLRTLPGIAQRLAASVWQRRDGVTNPDIRYRARRRARAGGSPPGRRPAWRGLISCRRILPLASPLASMRSFPIPRTFRLRRSQRSSAKSATTSRIWRCRAANKAGALSPDQPPDRVTAQTRRLADLRDRVSRRACGPRRVQPRTMVRGHDGVRYIGIAEGAWGTDGVLNTCLRAPRN